MSPDTEKQLSFSKMHHLVTLVKIIMQRWDFCDKKGKKLSSVDQLPMDDGYDDI